MTSVFKVSFAALVIAVGTVAVEPALAHHSSAGFGSEVRVISGTIKEFQFKNPHTWIQVLVEEGGKTTEWSLEWGSPNQLGRMGYRPSSFPAGAKVTVRNVNTGLERTTQTNTDGSYAVPELPMRKPA